MPMTEPTTRAGVGARVLAALRWVLGRRPAPAADHVRAELTARAERCARRAALLVPAGHGHLRAAAAALAPRSPFLRDDRAPTTEVSRR